MEHLLVELREDGIKFALAVVLAGALGLERQRKGRPAGLRTHIIVCLGCTLVMMVSQRLAQTAVDIGQWADPGRVAAGILTGVGFLGAGTIIHNGVSEHRGLTTAAMVWFVAGLGIAIGTGWYAIAIIATVAALSVTIGLEYLEQFLWTGEHVVVYVSAAGGLATLEEFKRCVRAAGFDAVATKLDFSSSNKMEVKFEFAIPAKYTIEKFASALHACFPGADKITFEG